MGSELKCVDPGSEKISWKRVISPEPTSSSGGSGTEKETLDSTLSPPALVNDKVFAATSSGDVVCLSAATGEVIWNVPLGEPIVFQPSVAKGRVYASTYSGSLYSIETGDSKDDGWLMWGANAAHSGAPRGA